MTVTIPFDELPAMTGAHLGYSPWHEVGQRQIDDFAATTGDDQWIHVDVERAKEGPYGSTIAHGCLTISLIPVFLVEIFSVTGVESQVNYGFDRIRLYAPVPAGGRVRAGSTIVSVQTRPGRVLEVTHRVVVELEGRTRPACVADMVTVLIPTPAPAPEAAGVDGDTDVSVQA